MSRSRDDLVLWFQPKIAFFCHEAERDGLPVKITRTLTTELVQHAIWKVGREELTNDEKVALLAEGLFPDDLTKIKTNAAHAHETPHGIGLAIDCVPLKDGKLWWDAPDAVWERLYKIAERAGLDALGDKWGEYLSWDKGHFQEPGWRIYRPGGVWTKEPTHVSTA